MRERLSVAKLLNFINEVTENSPTGGGYILDSIYFYTKDNNGKETPVFIDNIKSSIEKYKSVDSDKIETDFKLISDPYDDKYVQFQLKKLCKKDVDEDDVDCDDDEE